MEPFTCRREITGSLITMIQEQSYLEVADNSGARKLMCIRVLGGSKKKFAKVGDVIKVTVKEAIPTGRVKKGEVIDAVIVRTKNKLRRSDGSAIRFDDNLSLIHISEPTRPY